VTGSVSRTYDTERRVKTRSVNGGQTVTFQFDDDGLLTGAGALTLTPHPQHGLVSATGLGVVSTTRDYNAFGELETDAAAVSATTIYDVVYIRDKLGRISRKTETVEGLATVFDYTYDLVGRLKTVTTDGLQTARYDYDLNGNRNSGFTLAGPVTASYDDQDRLNSYNQQDYTYTDNGELETKTDTVSGEVTQYDYDVLGNLMSVTLADGTVIEYVIDTRNRRIGKKVDGLLQQGLLYKDQLNPVAELDGANNVISRFVYGNKLHVPAYMEKGGQIYRIVSDHLGSVRLVIDTVTGLVAQRMDYDEFGNVLIDTNSGFQPFGYAGGLYDADTGLVRFGARDYDPGIGRWTVKDLSMFAGGDPNLYAYASNSPISFIDFSGQEAFPSDFADVNSDAASPATIRRAAVITFGAPLVFVGATLTSTSAATAVGFGAIAGSLNGALSAAASGGGPAEILTASVVGLGIATGVGLTTLNPIAAGFAGGAAGQVAGDALTTGQIDVDKAIMAGIIGSIGGSFSSIFAKLGTSIQTQIVAGALFEFLGTPLVAKADEPAGFIRACR
jgi:RHS repeat-associated protein